jgi:serine/threonine protein kinase
MERAWSRRSRLAGVSPTADAPCTPGTFGRYRVVREVGRGAYGVVLLAHDPLTSRPVALKMPRPEVIEQPALWRRFLREAEAAVRLDHPQIVPVLEVGYMDTIPYIAMGYCSGPTLHAWMQDGRRPLPPASAARLLSMLADAAHHAHQQGVLHRDIKPGNVLLEPCQADCAEAWMPEALDAVPAGSAYIPMLSDFGLAKIVDPGREDDETVSGSVIGTSLYMAPELAAGQRQEIGPHSDVFSLGIMLQELLRPAASAARPIPPMPPDLQWICRKCIAAEVRQRYASAADLAADLRRFLDGRPVKARIGRRWTWK